MRQAIESEKIWQEKLVRAAMRENNRKRSYLIVNPSQGKHVPVAPSAALDVFSSLAAKVQECTGPTDPVLIIAFAETATAIGAAVAASLTNPTYLMHTTRENVEDTDFLFFSEAHSHATEQRLALRDLDPVLKQVKHIVFVEDEVTTGNTIWNLMTCLGKQAILKDITFGIASLLNGMLPQHKERFEKQGVFIAYLLHTDNAALESSIGQYAYDGLLTPVSQAVSIPVKRAEASGMITPRCVVEAKKYQDACRNLAGQAAKLIPKEAKRVLILGTEECMYPGLMAAKALERSHEVRFHATTRSPILVSGEGNYPLHRRNALISCYDKQRATYIYNLASYDFVLIVTDTSATQEGIRTLAAALEQAGNKAVTVLEWRH
nr:phosphoribosyltransferase domain-containing protein [uncultured Solibaculum sp.]